MTQTARRNLIVTRYSTPSGHAAVIRTSEPNSTAIAECREQPGQPDRRIAAARSGEVDDLEIVGASTSVGVAADRCPGGVGADPGVVAVAASSGAASGSTPPSGAAFSTTKVITPRPSGSLSVLLTCQRAGAGTAGERIGDLDRQGRAVVEHLGWRKRDGFGFAVDRDRVVLAEFVGEADDDFVRRHVQDGAVGRRRVDDRVLRRCGPRSEADDRSERDQEHERVSVHRVAHDPTAAVRRCRENDRSAITMGRG